MPPTKTKPAQVPEQKEVSMNIAIPADLHRRVRVKCLNDGVQLKQAVEAGLREWIKR